MFDRTPHVLAFVAAALLAGCSHLPADGPTARDIDHSAVAGLHNERGAVAYDYALIDINAGVLAALRSSPSDGLYDTFASMHDRPPQPSIGPGDVLQLAVFESAAGGLFVSADANGRTGNFVSIPNLTVNPSGYISVPYAGNIHAAGRSVTQVERAIERKLAGRAIEPQVSVSFVEQNASMVSVLGDTVNAANKFKISGSGDRVLDVIAKAGGLRFPGYEVYVSLQRKGRRATVYFPKLTSDPRENIYVAPGDTIYVYREQKKFVAVGALGNAAQTSGITGQFAFEQEKLSLNEAMARAGGLLDIRANPSQVFVYRGEHRRLLEQLGVDLSRFPVEQKIIPTIYRGDFRDPSAFFFAQQFQMRNRDIIYATNAESIELAKLFAYIRLFSSTASGVAVDAVTTTDLLKGGVLVHK